MLVTWGKKAYCSCGNAQPCITRGIVRIPINRGGLPGPPAPKSLLGPLAHSRHQNSQLG